MNRHVDLFHVDWWGSTRTFDRRLALDDPLLVKPDGTPTQLAQGWASYYDVSEPHTMAECPHA
jgi:hypothetical protein